MLGMIRRNRIYERPMAASPILVGNTTSSVLRLYRRFGPDINRQTA